jgi:hypothetical protein
MKFAWPAPVELAVVAFCAWQARDLLAAWQYSATDRLAWCALLIWCLPTLYCWFRTEVDAQPGLAAKPNGSASFWLMTAALVSTTLGQLGGIHTLQHFGLATALVALARPSWVTTLPWLIGAVSWMPLLGWLTQASSPANLIPLRFALAAAASGWMMVGSRFFGRDEP